VGDLLDQLEQKLRVDAKAAQKLFPKAAKSGNDLAGNINELRLQPLARQATGQMLSGNGDRSYRLADRLRGEMEKLFSQCQGGNCPGNEELDSYLQLQRGMKPGRNFAQMARSRKFGHASGSAQGFGSGEGQPGSAGSAMMANSEVAVIGNEPAARHESAAALQASRAANGTGTLARGDSDSDREKAEVVKGLNPVNRQSGAVASETALEEYSDLVDNYFKAITTKKKP
jgi:hypothetical protein